MSCGCLQDEMRRKAGKPMGPGRWMKTIRGAQGECLKCGSSDSLHAHHIFPAGRYPHLALDLSNGAALCAECHKAFHRRYGKECANVDDLCGWLGLDEASTEAIRSFVGWRSKGGVEDLKKARHFLDMLIERESG